VSGLLHRQRLQASRIACSRQPVGTKPALVVAAVGNPQTKRLEHQPAATADAAHVADDHIRPPIPVVAAIALARGCRKMRKVRQSGRTGLFRGTAPGLG
jgi:hypothetical protein